MAKAKVILAPGEVVIPDPENPNRDVVVTRRASTIENLVRSETLKLRHKLAAERLYLSYVMGHGVKLDEPIGLPMGQTPGWMMAEVSELRMGALKEYREAVNALGHYMAQAVVPVVLYNLTLKELAKSLHMREDVAKGYLKGGMDVLANHYGIAVKAEERA